MRVTRTLCVSLKRTLHRSCWTIKAARSLPQMLVVARYLSSRFGALISTSRGQSIKRSSPSHQIFGERQQAGESATDGNTGPIFSQHCGGREAVFGLASRIAGHFRPLVACDGPRLFRGRQAFHRPDSNPIFPIIGPDVGLNGRERRTLMPSSSAFPGLRLRRCQFFSARWARMMECPALSDI